MGFENHFPLGKHSLFKQMNPRYAVDDETYLTSDLNLTEKVSSWNINHSEIDRFKLLSEYIMHRPVPTDPGPEEQFCQVKSEIDDIIQVHHSAISQLSQTIKDKLSEKRSNFSTNKVTQSSNESVLFVIEILIYSEVEF